jgi:hypothetical protein
MVVKDVFVFLPLAYKKKTSFSILSILFEPFFLKNITKLTLGAFFNKASAASVLPLSNKYLYTRESRADILT